MKNRAVIQKDPTSKMIFDYLEKNGKATVGQLAMNLPIPRDEIVRILKKYNGWCVKTVRDGDYDRLGRKWCLV